MKKENNENKKKKNKKKFLIVAGLSLFTILGGTLAYFTTSTNITNKFKAALYQNEIVEIFESPSNWTPGTVTEKTVKVTNTGSIKMAVRAKYSEKWINANGEEMNLKDENNNVAALIDFASDWTKDEDGFYYYGSKENMTILEPGKTTSSFINSVTFNENIKASLSENISDNGQTITYSSTGEGYDNAQYILTIRLDTIQYDQSKNIWK